MIESQKLIVPKSHDRNGKEVSLPHEEMQRLSAQRLSEDAYRAYRLESIKSWTFLQTPPLVHVVRGFRAVADMLNTATGGKKTSLTPRQC